MKDALWCCGMYKLASYVIVPYFNCFVIFSVYLAECYIWILWYQNFMYVDFVVCYWLQINVFNISDSGIKVVRTSCEVFDLAV